ncbi:MAG TPA: histidine phosphatase family protein, partial [Solirubrobacteraceae bacterium]
RRARACGRRGRRAGGSAEARPVIVLVRHGETEWSVSGQHTSRTDLPLTEPGRARATALAPRLSGGQWALVLSSPLRRARETCELAGLGEQMTIDEDLREWDYGEYEGLTTAQIHQQRPDWVLWRDGCPGGETPDQVGVRADRVLARMRGAGGDCVAFAHGHILRVTGSRWAEQPVSFGSRIALSAGSVSTLGFERETEVLSEWNSVRKEG